MLEQEKRLREITAVRNRAVALRRQVWFMAAPFRG
jgi:hypothetical protein